VELETLAVYGTFESIKLNVSSNGQLHVKYSNIFLVTVIDFIRINNTQGMKSFHLQKEECI